MGDLGAIVFVLIMGLSAVVGGGYLIYTDMASQANAEPVDGSIVESEVDVIPNQDSRKEPTEVAQISYRYTYDGERYVADNICPGEGSGCYNAREAVENHPNGKEVTVHVDPDEPSQAYLLQAEGFLGTGVQPLYAGAMVIGLFGLATAAIMARDALRG